LDISIEGFENNAGEFVGERRDVSVYVCGVARLTVGGIRHPAFVFGVDVEPDNDVAQGAARALTKGGRRGCTQIAV
jgi:hypothetical protein